MQIRTLRAVLIGSLVASGCSPLDESPKTSCAVTADCLDGRTCQAGMCVTDMPDALAALTNTVSGMVGGETPTFSDAGFIPGAKCGVYIAMAGNSLAACTMSNLKQSIKKPYIQLNLTTTDVGTYSLYTATDCAAAPGGKGFFATFDGQTTSTDDALSGSVTVVSSSAGHLEGRYDITFTHDGTTSAGRLQGSFVAHACP